MTDHKILNELERVRAVPVIRANSPEEAIQIATQLVSGGLTIIEATFTTPGAEQVIEHLAADPNIVVGAGTVLTPTQARSAVRAGAQFLVSPLWLPWLPDLARELGVAAMPGAATPSEIWQATTAGVAAVKVFPIARLGGPAYIKDLLAPLPDLRLMATGGVDLPMAKALLRAGCIADGLGSVHKGSTLGATVQERAARVVTELADID